MALLTSALPAPNNSYRDVVRVSMPLVVSMCTTVVMTFTDRVFLANYSINAIAAALPAGITAFVFLSFFQIRRDTAMLSSPSIPEQDPCGG
ncbi:MAG: hypothetical protein P8X85_20545 [Desulfobacterales bacterium]